MVVEEREFARDLGAKIITILILVVVTVVVEAVVILITPTTNITLTTTMVTAFLIQHGIGQGAME
jgi:hypothetical protein